jgi:hypothetical protein
MQCEYCGKQAFITHICPYCREYYCLEHREPRVHECLSHGRQCGSHQVRGIVETPTIIPQKPTARASIFEGAQKKLFAASFALVVTEEILRLISYAKNPPFLAYLDGNIYVEILCQSITPQIASAIIFVLACFILFGTSGLASRNRSANNSSINLLKQAVPLCIFASIIITYLFSVVNWLFILTT